MGQARTSGVALARARRPFNFPWAMFEGPSFEGPFQRTFVRAPRLCPEESMTRDTCTSRLPCDPLLTPLHAPLDACPLLGGEPPRSRIASIARRRRRLRGLAWARSTLASRSWSVFPKCGREIVPRPPAQRLKPEQNRPGGRRGSRIRRERVFLEACSPRRLVRR